jgi:hypothetical protein
VKRFVIEQLCGPFDGVDLGNFGRYDEAGNFEQLPRRNIAKHDRFVWLVRSAQSAVFLRILAAEIVDELVVLTREDVVVEAQADGPVIWERGGLLAFPEGIDVVAIGFIEHG